MNSATLSSFGFASWHPLNLSAEKSLLAIIPSSTGVYAMRCRNSQRICGPFDLVYFGKATNADGLKTRVRQYFHPGHGNKTSLRIGAEFANCADFELSWIEFPSDRAVKVETLLIASYEKQHGALPLWNKRR